MSHAEKRPLTLEKAANIGKAFAKEFYQEFVDHPEFRGDRFTWAGWVNMCYSHAVSAGLLANYTKAKAADIARSAHREACKIVKTLVEQKP